MEILLEHGASVTALSKVTYNYPCTVNLYRPVIQNVVPVCSGTFAGHSCNGFQLKRVSNSLKQALFTPRFRRLPIETDGDFFQKRLSRL